MNWKDCTIASSSESALMCMEQGWMEKEEMGWWRLGIGDTTRGEESLCFLGYSHRPLVLEEEEEMEMEGL